MMEDGIIELDTVRGQLLGFTSDSYDGYLWKIGDSIMVSAIWSKKKGNFRKLAERIGQLGFAVKVPTPLRRMEEIVRAAGYRHTVEDDDLCGPIDVWVLDPPLLASAEGAENSP